MSTVALSFPAVGSPDFYQPVQGGDIGVLQDTTETLNFPMVDASLDPLPCVASGPLQPGQSYCQQDGSTGDTSAPGSNVWSTIAGIAGGFLRGFGPISGSIGVSHPGAAPPTATATAAAAAAQKQQEMYLIVGGLAVLAVLLIVLLRK